MTLRSLASAALAVALISLGAASAQAPAGAQNMSDAEAKAVAQKVVMACESDIARLCPNVPPGGGQVIQCLKAQKAQVSFHCKRAIFQAKQAKNAADAAAQQGPH
ncbi:MAG TPA: cysteine rich repeat-containing protein [Caulobacteraceae bacterium]|jgi:hypothetical protein|nr:cysteine rich repeat-containing protein [Caulobacteraceae bacterium]